MATNVKGFKLTRTIHDFNVSYDDVGEGRVPIIFLHGYPFDKSTWRQQLTFLQTSHRAIAVDIRGYGGSEDPQKELSIDLFAEDLIRFMDDLSIETAIICGLSMGGYIALNTQKRFPDRFSAMILCDTQCNADSPEGKQKRYSTIDSINSGGAADFCEGFLQKVFTKQSLTHKLDVVEALRAVIASASDHSLTAGLVALAERSESCSTLKDVAIPTLIMCGQEDEVTPLAQSVFMHEQIKGSLLHVIDDAGHVSNLEQPDAFNRQLKAFLATL